MAANCSVRDFETIKYSRRLLCRLALLTASALMAGRAEAVDLIGYLPYYRMNGSYLSTTLPNQLAMLNEVRYFGLTINDSGAITPLEGSLDSHINNINTLKAKIAALPANRRPRLDITLGGQDEAENFATVAASPSLRTTLAQNIKSLLTQTNAASVDIDWEHPANNPTQLGNYSLMVKRIKQEVGASRGVYVAMAPQLYMPPSAFQAPNAIDGVSLMTYDLQWWGNDPDNPYDGEHSLPEYVTDAVNAWTQPHFSPNPRPYVFASFGNGTSPSVLGIGMPFYGRDIFNEDNEHDYSELVAGGTTTDGNYYNYSGQTVWTLDPDLVNQRVQFAHDRGLKNIIIWDLGQDLSPTNTNSLLYAAYQKNQSFAGIPGDYDGNSVVGQSDYVLWKSTFGTTTGGDLRADGNGNGRVDAADYVVWRHHVTALGGGAVSGTAVPEPATWLLACLALSFVRKKMR
jgi:GH18 family chitinase